MKGFVTADQAWALQVLAEVSAREIEFGLTAEERKEFDELIRRLQGLILKPTLND